MTDTKRWGAAPAEWSHFDLVLGLGDDLLPVVSNPTAKISPGSKMGAIGKTPSVYNRNGHAVGIPEWTSKIADTKQITQWSEQPDYGICVQTRLCRAIDVDVTDHQEAKHIREALDLLDLPTRTRANSSKFLLAFMLHGTFTKRTIRTLNGIIEFLATGQQFVAVGTHPSGARYEWPDGLPEVIPEMSPDVFEDAWKKLEELFAVAPSTTSQPGISKQHKIQEAIIHDETAQKLYAMNLVLSNERDGRLHITCPFESEHSGPSAESATTYFPANTGGYVRGHFHCLHAHCEHRTDDEFRSAIGMPVAVDDFNIVAPNAGQDEAPTPSATKRFCAVDAETFIKASTGTEWLVKGLIPRAALGVVFGYSGSGKTFWMLDMALSIASGEPWNGKKTTKGQVLYLAAEDAEGVRKRMRAYCEHSGIASSDMTGIRFMSDAPRFLQQTDRAEFAEALMGLGPLALVVIDTLSAVTLGGDENSGKDMGEVLAYCKAIHKHTGAMVLLVRHSGKNEDKGARGWSGVRDAADCEIQISRYENDRSATVTKLKNGMDAEVEFPFRLQIVDLGMDEDGESVTSCVVNHIAGKARPVVKDAVEKIILNVLDELALITGPVHVNRLVETTIDRLPAPEKNDRRRANVFKALERLVAAGLILSNNGSVVPSNSQPTPL